jgi:multiple sugar transport system substrate-binding protein
MSRRIFKKRVIMGLGIALLAVSIPSFALGAGSDPSAASLRGKTIYLAVISVPGIPEVLAHVGEFEKETGIKVNIEILPEKTLREKTTADLAFGTGIYDAIMFGLMYVTPYAEGNMLMPLNKFVDNEEAAYLDRIKLDDYIPRALEVNSYGGKLYGLPFYAESSFHFYRKDLFAQAGLTEPCSVEDIWNAAKKLTEKPNLYGIIMRGLRGGGLNVYTWTSWLWGYGGKFFDENMKPVLDSPEAIASVKAYADILKQYGPSGAAGFDWSVVRTYATEGKTAQFYDATPFVSMIEASSSQTRGKWGIVVPTEIKSPAGHFAPTIYTWSFGMSAHASEPWATWRFISWITSYEMSETLIKDGFMFAGALSRRSQVDEHPETAKTYWAAKTLDALAKAPLDFRPRIKEWPAVGDAIGAALSEVIAGQKTATASFKAVNEQVYRIMERAGAYK